MLGFCGTTGDARVLVAWFIAAYFFTCIPRQMFPIRRRSKGLLKSTFFLYLSLLFLADLFNQTTRENMSVKWALCQRRVTFSTYLLSVSLFTQRKSALLDHEFIHFSSSQCENLWRPWHFCQILFNSSITLRCFTKSCASHLYRMETQRGAFAFNHLFIELLQRGQITNHTTRAHRGRHDGQHADHLSRRDLRFGEVHLFASTIRGSIS